MAWLSKSVPLAVAFLFGVLTVLLVRYAGGISEEHAWDIGTTALGSFFAIVGALGVAQVQQRWAENRTIRSLERTANYIGNLAQRALNEAADGRNRQARDVVDSLADACRTFERQLSSADQNLVGVAHLQTIWKTGDTGRLEEFVDAPPAIWKEHALPTLEMLVGVARNAKFMLRDR